MAILLVAGLVGGLFSIIHAAATVHFRADHVVSGTVLNLMAPALAVFLVKVLYNKGQTDNLSQTFGRFDFPVLANIPVIGDIFFKSTSLLGLSSDCLLIPCLVYPLQDPFWSSSPLCR